MYMVDPWHYSFLTWNGVRDTNTFSRVENTGGLEKICVFLPVSLLILDMVQVLHIVTVDHQQSVGQ